MNIRWSVEENLYCIDDAGISTLIHDLAFADAAQAIAGQRPQVRLQVSLEPNPGGGAPTWTR